MVLPGCGGGARAPGLLLSVQLPYPVCIVVLTTVRDACLPSCPRITDARLNLRGLFWSGLARCGLCTYPAPLVRHDLAAGAEQLLGNLHEPRTTFLCRYPFWCRGQAVLEIQNICNSAGIGKKTKHWCIVWTVTDKHH